MASNNLGNAMLLLTGVSVVIMIAFLITHGLFLSSRPDPLAGPPPAAGHPEAEA